MLPNASIGDVEKALQDALLEQRDHAELSTDKTMQGLIEDVEGGRSYNPITKIHDAVSGVVDKINTRKSANQLSKLVQGFLQNLQKQADEITKGVHQSQNGSVKMDDSKIKEIRLKWLRMAPEIERGLDVFEDSLDTTIMKPKWLEQLIHVCEILVHAIRTPMLDDSDVSRICLKISGFIKKMGVDEKDARNFDKEQEREKTLFLISSRFQEYIDHNSPTAENAKAYENMYNFFRDASSIKDSHKNWKKNRQENAKKIGLQITRQPSLYSSSAVMNAIMAGHFQHTSSLFTCISALKNREDISHRFKNVIKRLLKEISNVSLGGAPRSPEDIIKVIREERDEEIEKELIKNYADLDSKSSES